MEPLPNTAIAYRAMAKKGWIDRDANRANPAAFFRRPPPKDADGLSLDIESAASCFVSLKTCHGVASLEVGGIRVLGLDVVPDDVPHATLAGLPRQEEDPAKAEHLAAQLAKLARIVPAEQYATNT